MPDNLPPPKHVERHFTLQVSSSFELTKLETAALDLARRVNEMAQAGATAEEIRLFVIEQTPELVEPDVREAVKQDPKYFADLLRKATPFLRAAYRLPEMVEIVRGIFS